MWSKIKSKARYAFMAVGFALAMALGWVFAGRRQQPTPSQPEVSKKTAGELARLKEDEARRLAEQRRQQDLAKAEKKAELDAKLTDLRDYVRNRKR